MVSGEYWTSALFRLGGAGVEVYGGLVLENAWIGKVALGICRRIGDVGKL